MTKPVTSPIPLTRKMLDCARVICELQAEDEVVTRTQIADEMDCSKGEVTRLLEMLHQRGWLIWTSMAPGYALTQLPPPVEDVDIGITVEGVRYLRDQRAEVGL